MLYGIQTLEYTDEGSQLSSVDQEMKKYYLTFCFRKKQNLDKWDMQNVCSLEIQSLQYFLYPVNIP